jgi:hypothetical protein
MRRLMMCSCIVHPVSVRKFLSKWRLDMCTAFATSATLNVGSEKCSAM